MKSVRLAMIALGALFATGSFAQEQKIDRQGELRPVKALEQGPKSRIPVRTLDKREVKVQRALHKVDPKNAQPASEH